MSSKFTIAFNARQSAAAIHIAADAAPAVALRDLALPRVSGVVVVHGGAGKMPGALRPVIRRFLATSLVSLAERQGVLIADGGTDLGVPRALGEAREEAGGTFPLIGVVPHRFAGYPGGPKVGGDRVALNPAHSHFIFVDAEDFGGESAMLVGLLQAAGVPGVAMVINGGGIVFQEVQCHASQGNTIIAVRGTGRVADALAHPDSEQRRALPAGTKLKIANLYAPGELTQMLGALFGERREFSQSARA